MAATMALPTVEFKYELLETLNNGGEDHEEAACVRVNSLLNEANLAHVTFHVDCNIGVGVTPLHVVAVSGCCRCIQALLDIGAVIDCFDNEQRSILYYAVETPTRKR